MLSLKFHPTLIAISCHKLSSCQKKSFDSRNGLRDMKSNCMPKISLIGWVWNFTLFWQLISCYELSSCHKKVLTPEIGWGMTNLTACQKSVWLIEFEILLYFDNLSVVTSRQAVTKNIVFINLLRTCESSFAPNLSSLGCVEDTFPVGRSGGDWKIMLSSAWLSLAKIT